MYKVDLGYDFVEDKNIIMIFETLGEAIDFADRVLRETGEIIAIIKDE